MTAVTIYQRLEPRPRTNDPSASLRAPIHDPMWFLTRQWQLGELQGRDAGSLAYVEYFGSSSPLPRFVIKGQVSNVNAGAPLEQQTLTEPFEPDLSLCVELGQLFGSLLADQVTDETVRKRLLAAFLANFGLKQPTSSGELDPIDPATQRFLRICLGRAIDGHALTLLAQSLASGGAFPTSITTNATEQTQVKAALAALLTHVGQTFGSLGTSDPGAWTPSRLEYSLNVVAVDPSGSGNATLRATPNAKGEFDWYSFDVVAKNTAAVEAAPTPIHFVTIPSSARFPGMPNPRYWYIEENTLAYADVKLDPTDIISLLVTDMMLVHGSDWFLLPFDQTLGTAVVTKGLVVTDVFGHRNLVQAANRTTQPAGLDRWAMYAHTDEANGQRLSNYFVVPQSSGSLAHEGITLEDVRLARDEVADMAWAIERRTLSPIREPRSGRERDAEIDASVILPPTAAGEPDAALLYRATTRVPANWIPLIGVQPIANDPSIQFEKAAMLHPTSTGVGVVPALGKFLRPTDIPPAGPYRLVAEEVPRDGLTLVRAVKRSRWVDGSTHLWVSRRRVLGAGEAQSGLRFDVTLPNPTT
jgi:hypothetical protein